MYKKNTRGDNFIHTPTPSPFSDSHQFWRVGLGGRRNQTCQLLSKSVQKLCPLRRLKFALLHWPDASPLQQCKCILTKWTQYLDWMWSRNPCSLQCDENAVCSCPASYCCTDTTVHRQTCLSHLPPNEQDIQLLLTKCAYLIFKVQTQGALNTGHRM